MKKLICLLPIFVAALCNASDDGNRFELSGSYRIFPGDEKSSYYGLSVRYHGDFGYDYFLRGSSSSISDYRQNGRVFRSGGNDSEFMVAKDIFHDVKLGFGVASPRTAIRSQQLAGTYNLRWVRPLTTFSNLGLGTRGVVFGGSVGIVYADSDATIGQVCLLAEVGVPYVGQNTYNTTTGNQVRRIVASVGARLNLSPTTFLQFAYTNELGETTGMSVTPSLGGSFGLASTFGVRF